MGSHSLTNALVMNRTKDWPSVCFFTLLVQLGHEKEYSREFLLPWEYDLATPDLIETGYSTIIQAFCNMILLMLTLDNQV